MRLSPRELEGLLIHQTGFLAQKRLARGLKLNLPEAVALIASQVRDSARPWITSACMAHLFSRVITKQQFSYSFVVVFYLKVEIYIKIFNAQEFDVLERERKFAGSLFNAFGCVIVWSLMHNLGLQQGHIFPYIRKDQHSKFSRSPHL